jgi:hypothetical protein
MENYFEHKAKTKVERIATIAVKVVLGIMAIIAFAFLVGYGVMLLWNWLIPDIFGGTAITYWQAVGILVLVKILFGGFGGHKPKGGNRHSRNHLRRKMRQNCRNDFQAWKYYEKFWEEEGKDSYKEYVERIREEDHRR